MQTNSIAADLRAKGRASSLILLQTVKELTGKQENAPPYFIARFEKSIDDVKAVAEGHSSVSEDTLAGYREEVTEAIKELFTFKLYVDIVRDWAMHGSLLYVAANGKLSKMPGSEELFQSMLDAILNIGKGEGETTVSAMQITLAFIPLRMASLKYKGYISDALKSMNLTIDPSYADGFDRFFNPGAYISKTGWLADIKKPLDEIWEMDCTAINPGLFKECVVTVSGLRQEITKALDCFCALLDGLNASLICMKSGTEYAGEDMRKLTDAELDSAIDKEMKKIVYGPESEELPEDPLFKEIHDLFYETGLDYFHALVKPEDGQTSDWEGFLAAFLPRLDAPGLAPNRRRFLRQHLMSILNYPYPVESYKKYFIETYNALDEANRMYMIAYVTTLLNDTENSLK
jgi:hypothetical protein